MQIWKVRLVMQGIDLALLRLQMPESGLIPEQNFLSNGETGPPRDLQKELQVLREEVFRIWEDSSH